MKYAALSEIGELKFEAETDEEALKKAEECLNGKTFALVKEQEPPPPPEKPKPPQLPPGVPAPPIVALDTPGAEDLKRWTTQFLQLKAQNTPEQMTDHEWTVLKLIQEDDGLAKLGRPPMDAPPSPDGKQSLSYWVNYYLRWYERTVTKYDKHNQIFITRWPVNQVKNLLSGIKEELHCREPRIHSGIEGALPGHHKLAFETVACDSFITSLGQPFNPLATQEVNEVACGKVLHFATNENQSEWVETGCGNYCLMCYLCEVQVRPFEDFKLRDDQI